MDGIQTKESIMAAGLLDKLAEMFFKGIGKALDSAAEYEEEMGVLKQVNHIPITDTKGNTYTLTVKLAPVRGKDSYYFVEASCNAPGLDVSKLNNKTMKIDNTNMRKFKAMIDTFLENNGYDGDIPDDGREIDTSAPEVVGEEAESEKESSDETEGSNSDIAGEVENLIAQVDNYYAQSKLITNKVPLGVVEIAVTVEDYSSITKCDIKFEGLSVAVGGNEESGNLIVNSKIVTLDTIDEEGQVKDFNEFNGEITEEIQKYASENGLDKNIRYVAASSSKRFQVSLLKDKGSNEVNLTAINCSTDVLGAMDIIYNLVETPEFVDSLEADKEQSFSITDEGDDYDVEAIDTFDTSSTYFDIFAKVSQFANKLLVYKWAVGFDEWVKDSFLSSLDYPVPEIVQTIAPWVIRHTGMYPVPVSPFGNEPTNLEDLTDESGKVVIDKIHGAVKNELSVLVDELDIYYVNLNHEEQGAIDCFINNCKNALTYA